MILFSGCNDCLVCSCSGHCIAGHGDNHFCIASKNVLIERLSNLNLSNTDKNKIKGYLLIEHDYNYDLEKDKLNKLKFNKEGAAFSYLFD